MTENESERLIKTTIEEMLEGLQVIDWDWHYLYVNKAVAKQAFTTKEHLIGKTMMECFPGIENTQVFKELQFVMEKREPRRLENEFTFSNGQSTWFELYIEPHSRGILVRSFDIAERKKMEQLFRQSQKMEAIGRLAGNLAHNFNNKLAIMRAYCDLVLNQHQAKNGIRANIEKVVSTIKQSNVLTKQLLSFSHQQELMPRVVNPNTLLSEMKSSLEIFLGSNIKVEYKLGDSISDIKVDSDMWEQAILNLSINARDAMPKGGTLTISTEMIDLDESFVKIHPNMVTGKYVLIKVADTGCGIEKDTIERIFEPYFTTKDKGQGTGLGLPMVHGFVSQVQGCIIPESELNKGTTFNMYIPTLN